MKIAIVGAGIGGLAASLALARRGIGSHVLERRPAFNEDGAGIQIGPNGTRILRQLGIVDALRPHVGVPEALSVRDGPPSIGWVVVRVSVIAPASSWTGAVTILPARQRVSGWPERAAVREGRADGVGSRGLSERRD